MKIDVDYIPSEEKVLVLFDYLLINITKEYVQELTQLDDTRCKRVLYWLKDMYDEYEGINVKTILDIGKGVRSGLLWVYMDKQN